jgi:menaquinone-dependent protoporphyrinogen oxidase
MLEHSKCVTQSEISGLEPATRSTVKVRPPKWRLCRPKSHIGLIVSRNVQKRLTTSTKAEWLAAGLSPKSVKDLAPYRAVVVGSAIQAAQWLPEAMQFVRDHQPELARKPIAIFLVCMTLAMKIGNYRDQVADWLASVRALVRPVSEGLFAGVLNVRQVRSLGDRLKFRLSVMLGVWSEGDHRDWNAIHAWAESLLPRLLA